MTDLAASTTDLELWSGSYTTDSGGEGLGIGTVRIAANGELSSGPLGIATPSPSFLAKHPSLPVIYAVGETASKVRAFLETAPGTLEPFGDTWEAGSSVCHVTVDPAGRYLVACCWGDGQVLLYELDEAGAILNRLPGAPAVNPFGETDRPTRAHAALILPDGRIATTDLGFDLLRVWRYEPGTGLVVDHEVVFPRETEPRHLALHPSGRVVVVGEYSVTVTVLEADAAGRYQIVSRTLAMPSARPDDAASEISIDEAGRYVYVSVRRPNRVAVLAINDDGSLEPVGDVDCGGDWPRHHLVRNGLLLVANQRSNSIAAFRIDPTTGVPGERVGTVETGSPSCLLPRA